VGRTFRRIGQFICGLSGHDRVRKYEQNRETAHLRDFYTKSVTHAENTIANLMARGETADAQKALVDVSQVIAQGRKAGVFTAGEMQQFQNGLRQKMQQRMHPEIAGKVQQRVQAAQRAQP